MNQIIFIVLMLLLTAPSAVRASGDGHSDLAAIIKNATAPIDRQNMATATIAVPHDTVLAKVRNQGGDFLVETRTDKIERYRCSNCHRDGQPPVTIINAAAMAHGDIVLRHGESHRPLDCFTCHNYDNRDTLIGEDGDAIDFDHSYQLCGTCHFRQKRDWAGGAHGKRVSFWAGTRVIKTCTGCHNPHSPRFTARWPETYSRPLTK